MNYLYTKKQYIPSDEFALKVTNRGFHYGDGFFESIRVVNGKPCFFGSHFTRIMESMKALKMHASVDFDERVLSKEVQRLLEKNEIREGGRIRITFTRNANGTYLPDNNEAEYVIEAYPLEHNMFFLNQQGKNIDIFPDMKKQINSLSYYKTLNCQLYVMASIYGKQNGLDDCLIQNYKLGIIESTSSNLFIVSNGVLYTPGLEDGCIGGIMRMQIINLALENQIKVYECGLNPQNLLAADEIFLSNAIQGVQWVGSYRTKRYFNEMSRRMIALLNDQVRVSRAVS